MKKLERSRTNKMLEGVCGGIAEYYELDPTLVRVGFVFLTIITGVGPGIIGYIVLAIVMPLQGKSDIIDGETPDKK